MSVVGFVICLVGFVCELGAMSSVLMGWQRALDALGFAIVAHGIVLVGWLLCLLDATLHKPEGSA